MKRKGFLIWVLLLIAHFSYGQKSRLDSLLKQQDLHQKEDSVKLQLYIELMREYRSLKQPNQRYQYAQKAIDLGEKIKVLKPVYPIYNTFGLRYEGIGEFEKSIKHYNRGIELAQQFNDGGAVAGYSMNLGTVYQSLGDIPKSLSLTQSAAKFYLEQHQQENLMSCYINMGELYSDFSDQLDLSLSYYQKAIYGFRRMGKDGQIGAFQGYSGVSNLLLKVSESDFRKLGFDWNKRYQICRAYLDSAEVLAKEINDEDWLGGAKKSIGYFEETQGNFGNALNSFQTSLSIYQEIDRKNEVYQAVLNIGRVYLKQANLQQALPWLRLALTGSRELKNQIIEKDALFNLSQLHEKQQHFDSAYFFYKQFIAINDVINNDDRKREISRKQLQFEFSSKEKEYQTNQQLAENKIAQQEAFAIQQQQELSLREKQLELTNREKQIQQLNYLKKQAELENEKKLSSAQLKQKDLEKKLEMGIADQKLNEQQLALTSNRRISYLLGFFALAVTIAAVFAYKAKQKMQKLNELVLAQKTELEEMGKVKDKVFSIVSHDMRAPVNNLISFGSILEEEHIPQEKLTLYIEQIRGTLDHTSTMMENLLNWASSQMQGFEPVMEMVDLQTIVEDCINGILPALQKKQIEIDNKIVNTLTVYGDKNMIELVVRNLLNNALKFSNKQGLIEVYTTVEANGICALSISDKGLGLSQEKLDLINSNKVRSISSSLGTNKEKGTGLGLMLCKHFALLMKGSIRAISTKDQRTIVQLLLNSSPL
jgi:signal transduction histidine kinase